MHNEGLDISWKLPCYLGLSQFLQCIKTKQNKNKSNREREKGRKEKRKKKCWYLPRVVLSTQVKDTWI